MELDNAIDTRRLSLVSQHIRNAYKGSSLKEGPSPYIGADIIGHRCDRFIWLMFRWAFFYQTPLDGLEELARRRERDEKEYAVHDLNSVGVNSTYVYPEQNTIDLGCHVQCSPDGYLPAGLGKEESLKPHLLKVLLKDKRFFHKILDAGIYETDRQLYCQLQVEMFAFDHHMKMPCERALCHVVCKDNELSYDERIALIRDDAKALIERGHYLALEKTLPEGDWCEDCGNCPFFGFCNNDQPASDRMLPEVNCRTCCFSTPKEDGTWYCEKWEDTIPSVTAQNHGCDCHCIMPELVPGWKVVGGTECGPCYEIPGMGTHQNGSDGESTTHIMRGFLKKEEASDEYLDIKYHLEDISDPNDVIPF